MEKLERFDFYIGIDVGTRTGVAIWSTIEKKFFFVGTMAIHRAMELVLEHYKKDLKIIVIVEDARKRQWFGNSGREKLQGVGSVKRDSSIWDDFLRDKGIPYRMQHPKNNITKLDDIKFKRFTGWGGSTSQHARDAAMLVFGM